MKSIKIFLKILFILKLKILLSYVVAILRQFTMQILMYKVSIEKYNLEQIKMSKCKRVHIKNTERLFCKQQGYKGI